MANITIYTDGSYIPEKGYGWGFVIYKDGNIVARKAGKGDNPEAAAMHNVAGELSAVMRAVLLVKQNGYTSCTLCYDYQGVEKWVTGGWKAKNQFTQAYARFMKGVGVTVSFVKVKGHSGVEGNEIADQLAKSALN